MKSIKKMFDAYANNPDWELEELERSVIEAVSSMTLYMAVVPTYYEVHAIADSRAKARSLALNKAKEFLDGRGVYYPTLKAIEDELGCNIYQFEGLNTAIIE